MHSADYVVIVLYMIAMVAIGTQQRNASSNFADYVRMGSKSTWWMAGMSLFMSSFSAITFTGIAGSAYLAGWSVLVIQWCNALALFIQGMFLAPMLRRTRADTPKDAVRMRFGRPVEQLLAYVGTLSSCIWGGTFLLSLATIASVVFDIPLWMLILAAGGVVVFYSVSGGSWSVQITDSIQGFILIPVTVAFAGICLYSVGGPVEFFTALQGRDFSPDYSLFKPDGYIYHTPIPVEVGMFTVFWGIATVVNTLVQAFNLQQCGRYLSLKNERDSQKAAYLAGFLTLAGSAFWFIPPITGRILFAEQIEAVTGLGNPADAAYAITALNLLPPGLLGLILVAMLAATMSSMDSFLTGTAAIIVKNMYIPLMQRLGKTYREGASLLRLTKTVNLFMGVWSICMAFILSHVSGSGGIFGIMMTTLALVAAPTSMPLALALVCRRITLWGFYMGVIIGFSTSLTLLIVQKTGYFIPWYSKIFIMAVATIVPTYLSSFFWKYTKVSFRQHVDVFFETVRKPVDVESEIGTDVDERLLRMVSGYTLISAVCILSLLIWGRSTPDRIAIVSISVSMFIVGGCMWYRARALRNAE